MISSTLSAMATVTVSLLFLGSQISEIGAAPVAPGPNFNDIHYMHNWTFQWANGSVQGLGAIDDYHDVDAQMAQSLKAAINSAAPGYVASLTSNNTNSSTVQPMSAGLQSSTTMSPTSINGTTMGTVGAMGATGSTPAPPVGATGPQFDQSTGAPLDLMTPSTSAAPHRRRRDASTPTPPPPSAPSNNLTSPSSTTTSTPTNSSSTIPTNSNVIQHDDPSQVQNLNQQHDSPSDPSTLSSTQAYGTDEEFYARTDLVHFHVDIDLPEGSGDKPFAMPSIQ